MPVAADGATLALILTVLTVSGCASSVAPPPAPDFENADDCAETLAEHASDCSEDPFTAQYARHEYLLRAQPVSATDRLCSPSEGVCQPKVLRGL